MKMAIIRKNIKTILLLAFIVPLIGFVALSVWPSHAGANTGLVNPPYAPWLLQYVGQNVRVTFVTVPTELGTNLEKTSALKLLEAGQAGIVVTFRPNRTVFFPYSEILSIEPIYNRN
jgi:hypothetical protein